MVEVCVVYLASLGLGDDGMTVGVRILEINLGADIQLVSARLFLDTIHTLVKIISNCPGFSVLGRICIDEGELLCYLRMIDNEKRSFRGWR